MRKFGSFGNQTGGRAKISPADLIEVMKSQ